MTGKLHPAGDRPMIEDDASFREHTLASAKVRAPHLLGSIAVASGRDLDALALSIGKKRAGLSVLDLPGFQIDYAPGMIDACATVYEVSERPIYEMELDDYKRAFENNPKLLET
jgi:hypothetical protein